MRRFLCRARLSPNPLAYSCGRWGVSAFLASRRSASERPRTCDRYKAPPGRGPCDLAGLCRVLRPYSLVVNLAADDRPVIMGSPASRFGRAGKIVKTDGLAVVEAFCLQSTASSNAYDEASINARVCVKCLDQNCSSDVARRIPDQAIPMTVLPIAAPAPVGRVASVDALRGLTILLMVFVNDLGPAAPSWMHHIQPPDADGMTLADVVFPWFLFIVGVSIPLALERARALGVPGWKQFAHILLRTAGLLIWG